MLPESETNVVYFADKLKTEFPSVAEKLEQIITDVQVPIRWVPQVRDIWVRDYMPIQVSGNQFVHFRYDPDYLKGVPRLRTAKKDLRGFLSRFLVKGSNLVVDGGNIVTDGQTVIMTEKVFAENSKMSRSEVEVKLRVLLGSDHPIQMVFLPVEPHDLIGHSDGMVRFYAPGQVLVNNYSWIDQSFSHSVLVKLDEYGIGYKEIPYFNREIPRGNKISSVGNYINYLRVGNLIIIPIYKDRRDDQAVHVITESHPGVEIKTLDCRKIAQEGGCWNCLSWCIKESNPDGFAC
jgi:agmatine deiminase